MIAGSMVSTPLDIPLARAPRERSIYTWAALAALFFVFAGFARTYYLKAAFGAPDLSALKHLHGLVMTAWFVLLRAGEARRHRTHGGASQARRRGRVSRASRAGGRDGAGDRLGAGRRPAHRRFAARLPRGPPRGD